MWPLVIALVAVATRRRHLRLVLALLVVAVVAASGWASATLAPVNAPWAYFSLHTRAWELGVGALLALAAPRLVALPRRLAGLAAWLGLAAIVVAAVRFTDATPFPGVAAWLPVGGAALVVASGCGPRVGAERLLAEPFVQCLGRVSYSWYLWHWPLLVVTPYALGHALGVGERLAVVWVSLALAIASFTWVEQPARLVHWPTWGWIGAGGVLGGLVTACSALVMVLGPATTGTGAAAVLAAVDAPGTTGTTVTTAAPAVARSTGAGAAAPTAAELAVARTIAAAVDTTQVPSNLTPLPQDAADSLPPTSLNGCHAGFTAVTQGDCRYGDLTATRTVVLFGDSHAEQWLPALDDLGKAQHWQVVSWTKAACPAARLTVDNPSLGRTYTECDTWREATVARIGALHPALVVMSQSENVASSSVAPQAFSAATVATVQALRPPGRRRSRTSRTSRPRAPTCRAASPRTCRTCGRAPTTAPPPTATPTGTRRWRPPSPRRGCRCSTPPRGCAPRPGARRSSATSWSTATSPT